jgi:nitroimidazol reductase NimA-like FMN-containing flavoprotein (pyridoxamine 5'-phosphate oxidase superfamily)
VLVDIAGMQEDESRGPPVEFRMAGSGRHRVARLACAKDGQPYVVPIYFPYADSHLYAFSVPGKKIEWMRGNPMVSLQVLEGGERREWKSVVVDGRYEE